MYFWISGLGYSNLWGPGGIGVEIEEYFIDLLIDWKIILDL